MKIVFILIFLLVSKIEIAYADGGVLALGSFFEDIIFTSLIGAIIIISIIVLIKWSNSNKPPNRN